MRGGQSLNFAMPVEWIGDVKPGRKPAAEARGQTEWLKRAVVLEEGKDWQGLLDWCRKWTNDEPGNVNAWYGLGVAYGKLNRYQDAIGAFRQAVRIHPTYARAWYNLGVAYGKTGNRTSALDSVRALRRLDPESADKLFNVIVPR